MIDRRAILIALAKTGQLRSDRALQVRSLHEDDLVVWLLKERMPESVLQAAGAPVLSLNMGRRRPTLAYVQQQVDVHLAMLGFDPVPIEFVHPHLAERMPLHLDWEQHFVDVHCQWALQIVHHRVARIFAHGQSDAWKPLLNLIERGVHPYGLSPEAEKFILVDTRVDHLKALQDQWNEANAE